MGFRFHSIKRNRQDCELTKAACDQLRNGQIQPIPHEGLEGAKAEELRWRFLPTRRRQCKHIFTFIGFLPDIVIRMESILKDTLCFLDAIPQIDYEDLVRRLIWQ
jgi:hypothetical protein